MEVVVILKGIKCVAFTATLHEVTIMQDDVILLLQPESFRALLVQIGAFLIYTSLRVPNLLVKGKPERILVKVVKSCHRANGIVLIL